MTTKIAKALAASDEVQRAWDLIDKAREIVCESSDTLGKLGYLEAVGRLNALACVLHMCLDMAGDMSDMRDVLKASIRRDALLLGADRIEDEDMPNNVRRCDESEGSDGTGLQAAK